MLAQWVEMPDSVYVPDQLIVWFRPGVLNLNYLGCDENYDPTAELPLTGDFILNPDILSYLKDAGATSIKKIFDNLNPCEDTVSLSRGGDLICMPDFWNQLLVEFDGEQLQTDIPNLAIFLSIFFQNAIKIAEPNYVVRFEESKPRNPKTCVLPNDPYFYQQFAIKKWDPVNQYFGIGVDSAWTWTMGSPNIRIAVIEDGIDIHHPDFGINSQVVIGGESNNFLYGYDTLAWHGTRVAGIISALTNNDTCIAGIAGGSGNNDNAKLIALKIGDSYPNGKGTGDAGLMERFIIEASYAKPNGTHVQGAWGCHLINISASIPGPGPAYIRAAAAFAKINDVLICCAMGNGSDSVSYTIPEFPAALDDDWLLSVGGSSQRDRDQSSRYGKSLDVLAPFSNKSTDVNYVGGVRNFNDVISCSGTSFSTPLATGTAALLLSYLDDLKILGQATINYLAPEDIIYLLAEGTKEKQTVPQTGYPLIKNSAMGYGIINALESMRRLVPPFSLHHIQTDYPLELSQGTTIDSVPIAFRSNISSSDTLCQVIQFEIDISSVPFDTTYSGIQRAWIRGDKTHGFPDIRRIDVDNGKGVIIHDVKLPLFRNLHWAEVLSFSQSAAHVRTFLYKFRKMGSGGPYQWLDNISPDSIRFAFSILDSSGTTGIGEPRPFIVSLSQPYPQPVLQSARVNFDLSFSRPAHLSYSIYDILGRIVSHSGTKEQLSEGMHSLSLPTTDLRNGVYLVVLTANGQSETRTIIVTR